MFVIGVAGQAQMGKDTLADSLNVKLNEADAACAKWHRAAFAANVKKVFIDTFGVDMAFVEKWKVIPEPPPGFQMTVRQGLQFIGDGFRKIQPSIWLDLAFRDKKKAIILSDVRYINEFRRVEKEGGLNILIGRREKLNDDPNGSEAEIRPYVEWCLNAFDSTHKIVFAEELRSKVNVCRPYGEVPKDIEMFDVFIRNDGTKEELYQTIDEQLVPFVKKFVFEFPSEEGEKEEKCLISS